MNMSFVKTCLNQYEKSLPETNIDSAQLTKLISYEQQALDSLRQRIHDDNDIYDHAAEQQLSQSVSNLNDLLNTFAYKNASGNPVSLYTASKIIETHVDSQGHFKTQVPHGKLVVNIDGNFLAVPKQIVESALSGMRYLANNAQHIVKIDFE